MFCLSIWRSREGKTSTSERCGYCGLSIREYRLCEKKLEILGNLIDLLETDEIDLVILNEAPLAIKMKILENKRIIVNNTPFLRHEYESLSEKMVKAGYGRQKTE